MVIPSERGENFSESLFINIYIRLSYLMQFDEVFKETKLRVFSKQPQEFLSKMFLSHSLFFKKMAFKHYMLYCF